MPSVFPTGPSEVGQVIVNTSHARLNRGRLETTERERERELDRIEKEGIEGERRRRGRERQTL